MGESTRIRIEFMAYYPRNGSVKSYSAFCEPTVEKPVWGFKKEDSDLGLLAEKIKDEVTSWRRIENPEYRIIPKKGKRLILAKVIKFNDYEVYTSKPKPDAVKKLEKLLVNQA